MEAKELIGLDIGDIRTGVARASMAARLAEPLVTVDTDKLIDYLAEQVKKNSVDTLVVGLPRNLSGQETAQTAAVRQWVDKAKAKIDANFYWQDEALTTHLAEAGRQTGKQPYDSDALAAAIILQNFLDTPQAARVLA